MRTVRFPILALLAACSEPDAAPVTHTTTGKPLAARVPSPIENFGRIADGIYRGAQPDASGYRYLREQGFKTVINLRSTKDEKKEVEAEGMTSIKIPMEAGPFGSTPPTDAQLKQFFELVLDASKRPVYFHCAHGKDRTGTIAALYRIEREGWTAEEAIEEMQAFGYHDIYKDLIKFVRSYRPRGFK
jgi:protein tyrosine/serine phosphatase